MLTQICQQDFTHTYVFNFSPHRDTIAILHEKQLFSLKYSPGSLSRRRRHRCNSHINAHTIEPKTRTKKNQHKT